MRLTAPQLEDRREPVLGLLRREEPAAGEAALASGGRKKHADPLRRQIAELERQIENRDQGIGEYTIANRSLKNFRASPFERGESTVDRQQNEGI